VLPVCEFRTLLDDGVQSYSYKIVGLSIEDDKLLPSRRSEQYSMQLAYQHTSLYNLIINVQRVQYTRPTWTHYHWHTLRKVSVRKPYRCRKQAPEVPERIFPNSTQIAAQLWLRL
jgi:hypothetical protein